MKEGWGEKQVSQRHLLLLWSLALGLVAAGCDSQPCARDSDCADGQHCAVASGASRGICQGACVEAADCPDDTFCSMLGACRALEPVQLRWLLHANDSRALVDADDETLQYPNPLDCDFLRLRITGARSACATCQRWGHPDRELCGGPEVGIPYRVRAATRFGKVEVHLMDTYGKRVARTGRMAPNSCLSLSGEAGAACEVCTGARGELLPSSSAEYCPPVLETFCDLVTVSEDRSCELCVDEERTVRSDDCPELTAGGGYHLSIDSVQCAVFTDSHCVVCYDDYGVTSSECVESPECRVAGAEAFFRTIDAALEEQGLPPTNFGIALADHLQAAGRIFSATGYTCAPAAFPDGGIAMVGGINCAQLGSNAMQRACHDLPESCAGTTVSYHAGVSMALNTWSYATWALRPGSMSEEDREAVDEFDCDPTAVSSCLGDPLLVDLSGSGPALTPANEGPAFDLSGHGRAARVGWPSRGSLLALDRDVDGVIDSGRELFVDGTPLWDGRAARAGLEVLSQYDRRELGGNGDGLIDARDPIYSFLRLWTDANADGVSQPQELTWIDQAGLLAIELRAEPVSACMAESGGNEIADRARLHLDQGGRGDLYEVWLDYGTR